MGEVTVFTILGVVLLGALTALLALSVRTYRSLRMYRTTSRLVLASLTGHVRLLRARAAGVRVGFRERFGARSG
ncbi:hypothetical protein H0B56_09745 [Haloechinothrix sp. YIM 98757]|uniref:Uncharacterized protein n=1 Tax=Haloechinothrix aidingensis TaxID=2752311 RepID=A0A838A3G9_9PSEU|nr:hypothetical protein [Haloechinothrix aidingensis]MBA0125823.1 hypothetical protein [Haloechinothrix aidingensis]